MIAILQPFVPHYREAFYKGLQDKLDLDMYCYENQNVISKNNFGKSDIEIQQIKAIKLGPFILYNPFTLLKRKYDVLVLMLTFAHVTTWILLLTKPFHRKKIILMGHGISVKRFVKEEKAPSVLLKYMIYLSDGIWFYTKHELSIWKNVFPKLKATALSNTISDVNKIVNLQLADKPKLKAKHNIKQEKILIYCARFNEPGRRVDLLQEIVNKADSHDFGFIIIGDGYLKPDFSHNKNVYDFGAVYDRELKDELFQIADIYFQPGWVGLSIVEAMAYGKPIFTFKRTEVLNQCVEYSYITNGFNGIIVDTTEHFLKIINNLQNEQIVKLGNNALNFAKGELQMDNMIKAAYKNILEIRSN